MITDARLKKVEKSLGVKRKAKRLAPYVVISVADYESGNFKRPRVPTKVYVSVDGWKGPDSWDDPTPDVK